LLIDSGGGGALMPTLWLPGKIQESVGKRSTILEYPSLEQVRAFSCLISTLALSNKYFLCFIYEGLELKEVKNLLKL
jgi:hypothetical protein